MWLLLTENTTELLDKHLSTLPTAPQHPLVGPSSMPPMRCHWLIHPSSQSLLVDLFFVLLPIVIRNRECDPKCDYVAVTYQKHHRNLFGQAYCKTHALATKEQVKTAYKNLSVDEKKVSNLKLFFCWLTFCFSFGQKNEQRTWLRRGPSGWDNFDEMMPEEGRI